MLAHRLPAAAGLFLLVFVVHAVSPSSNQSDSIWTVPQILSIVREGNTELNEFAAMQREYPASLQCVQRDFLVQGAAIGRGCLTGEAHGLFPVAVPALSTPVFVLMDGVLRAGDGLAVGTPMMRSFFARDYMAASRLVELVLASFFVALATVFVFACASEFLPLLTAIVLALLFAFGTSAWSTGSRALWQHGPAMMLLALGLYLVVSKRLVWSAAPLAMAYFVRPTMSISVACFGLYILFHHRSRFAGWCGVAACAAAPFVIYNWVTYRSVLQPYFRQQRFGYPTFDALAGQLISPSRGLLIFTPLLLFALAGIYVAVRGYWQTPLVFYLAAVLGFHWVAISSFTDWTAGACYGPRYWSEVLPVFIFFLIPLAKLPRIRAFAVLFVLCATVSIWIHYRGAWIWAVQEWNGTSVSSARAWDWGDPQFLRGL